MRNKRKFNKTKEWLINEYVVNNRPRKEIAAECGLSEAGLKSLLKDWGIYKNKLIVTKEQLEECINKKMSAEEIADHFGVYTSNIYKWHKKYGFTILAEPKIISQYDDSNDAQICEMYEAGMSSTEIAKYFNTTWTTILTHLDHCGIKRRTLSEAQWTYNGKTFPDDLKSYDTVYDLYITQKLSKKELANKYNCDTDVIDRILKKFNIPIRGCSESKIGVMVGDKHPNWQGGITGLHYRLREAFYVQQVPLVLARDHYCCQLCGSKENLQVHHKKHFTDILHRVLNEHSELDPVKDQNELYDIALKDSEFNDLDNLITYCKECHLFKVHRYKYKEEK